MGGRGGGQPLPLRVSLDPRLVTCHSVPMNELQPSAGADRLFTLIRLMARLLGPRMTPENVRHEARGVSGTINWEFLGSSSMWSLSINQGAYRIERGAAPDARTTLKVAPDTFHKILTGKSDYLTAVMTGRVRISGEGNFGFVPGVFAHHFKRAAAMQGWRGWFTRPFTNWILAGFAADEARMKGKP